MIKNKVISIIIIAALLFISWLNSIPNSKVLQDDPRDLVEEIIDDVDNDVKENIDNSNPPTSTGSRAIQDNSRAVENNDHGGSWFDGFDDSSGVESGFNYSLENSNIYLSYNSSEFSDSFEGTDGTKINVYDSEYSWFCSGPASTKTVEIDTGQKYHGSSSALLHIGDPNAYNLWFNRTVNFTLPKIDFNYYIRIYTGPSSHPNRVGCAYRIQLFSSKNQITFVDFYNGDIRYIDGGSVINTGKKVTHNTWYKITTSLYKINNKYSTYDFSIWNTNNLQTPIVSKTGINAVDSSYSVIDEFEVKIANVWDRSNSKGWFDKLSLKEIDYNEVGSIQSKPITLQQGMRWDTLVINKTEPTKSYLNITILDATNNQKIPGSPTYINKGEFDISYIDPVQYPKIKLNATFIATDFTSPVLHYWGVSWNASNTWQDLLFGGLRIESSSNVVFFDDEVESDSSGDLASIKIDIPDEHYYDTLIVNKTEPSGTSVKIDILDGNTDSPITGYTDLAENNIDLSALDPINFSSIKLKAIFASTGNTGILHGWSVNWTKNTKPRFINISTISTVNRTMSKIISINISDLEDSEDEMTIEVAYQAPGGTNWQTVYLSDPIYNNDHWGCTFSPPASAEPGQYSFMFNCEDAFQYQNIWLDAYFIEVLNNKPEILEISTLNLQVNRTKILNIFIDPDDIEIQIDSLIIDVKYKSPFDMLWQTQYISNVEFQNDQWEAEFTPTKAAYLGWYTLNITCSDTDTEIYEHIEIEVINNKPAQPGVAILPSDPKTTDDLTLLVSKAKDIETPLNKMEYWCYWYKDDEYMPEFDNQTIVPNSATTKYDIWRCDVYPFDGNGLGQYGTAEVTILNSPPELVEQFNSYEIFEDMPAILENKLTTIFSDPDSDGLTFSVTGQNNIEIEIMPENGTIKLTPAMNWFGSEYITFYAKDNSMAMAEESVLVTVTPTNDLPRIVQIGTQLITDDVFKLEFMVKQDEWLNLTIKVQDIDGDVERGIIDYILNISERKDLFFPKNKNILAFKPANADVGSHYLTIKITDNNETPAIYISKDIKIEVLNVNDRPTVEIIKPNNNVVFTDPKMLSFSCAADDIDLYIPDPTEELTYKWVTNRSEYDLIGTEKELILANETLLKPGYYEITVKVTDRAGDIAYDSVNIVIEKTVSESKPDDSIFSNYSLLGLIIIVIIIIFIIAILMFIVSQKHKKARAARALGLPDEQVLQPVEVYQPYQTPTIGASTIAPGPQISALHLVQSEPLASAPEQELLGPISTAPSSIQPATQLPPATPTITVPIPVPTPVQDGTRSELTVQQKLKLLEERLICGEIDQDIYLNLKAKLDLEAKPYQPPPQLPPATTPPPTETAPILTTPAPFTPQQPEQPSPSPIQPQQETTIDNAQPQQPLGPPQPPLEPQVQAQAQPQVQQQQEPQPEIAPQVPAVQQQPWRQAAQKKFEPKQLEE